VVESKSPPERAGDPPNTAENSLGICQQSIMKIIAAPIMSNALIIGLPDVATLVAATCQSTAKLKPAPISR
jgi:hypothetical protein